MADISRKITRKSLLAKKKDAIKTIKKQAKEKIKEVKLDYANNPHLKHSRAQEKQLKKELRAEKANARIAFNARRLNEYSLAEDLFNSISHGIAACLAVAILVLLVIKAALSNVDHKALYITSYSLFGAFLFLMFLMSTLYHALVPTAARKVFSVLNRISIFLWMGGTWTPYLLTQDVRSPMWIFFIILWVALVMLSIMYSTLQVRMNGFANFMYGALGIALTVMVALNKQLPDMSKYFYYAASACYLISCPFAIIKKVKGMHGVFHVLTIAGAVMQFFALFFAI